jgi:glutathione peroxidase
MATKLANYGMQRAADADILWNFEKFLISRTGEVVARFNPDVAPDDARLVAAIDAELAKGA